MARDNPVYRKIKSEVLNNPKTNGWKSTDLKHVAGVRTASLRHVCDQLVDEGILVKKHLENTKKGECRIIYFRTPENGSDIYGVGMANKINVHNIFA
tara:strand:+ start:627 stop:917 length:291 start_codon:yes stop_codon:yes gene_type:complete